MGRVSTLRTLAEGRTSPDTIRTLPDAAGLFQTLFSMTLYVYLYVTIRGRCFVYLYVYIYRCHYKVLMIKCKYTRIVKI